MDINRRQWTYITMIKAFICFSPSIFFYIVEFWSVFVYPDLKMVCEFLFFFSAIIVNVSSFNRNYVLTKNSLGPFFRYFQKCSPSFSLWTSWRFYVILSCTIQPIRIPIRWTNNLFCRNTQELQSYILTNRYLWKKKKLMSFFIF